MAICVPGAIPGSPILNLTKPFMNSRSDLQQFWKDFDHPYPPHGDDCATITVQDNSPILSKVTVDPTTDPKTHSTAVKYDSGKTDWSLMPFEAVEEINKVLEFGARKYAAHNWTQGDGFRYTRVLSSLFRHLFAWSRGEDLDPESGLSHLAHAGCNVIFLIYYSKYKDRYNNDDRFKR